MNKYFFKKTFLIVVIFSALVLITLQLESLPSQYIVNINEIREVSRTQIDNESRPSIARLNESDSRRLVQLYLGLALLGQKR